MLKLERIAKTRQLNVSLRDRQTLFSKPFLTALGYAAALHVVALLLFHVPKFSLPTGSPLTLPTIVATEFVGASAVLLTEVDSPLPPPYVIAPLPMAPSLPTVAFEPPHSWNWQYQLKVFTASCCSENPFDAVEHSIGIPQELTLFAGPAPQAPVAIHLAGQLAAAPLSQFDSHEEDLLELLQTQPRLRHHRSCRFVYDVYVDSISGIIFWWESKIADGDKLFEELALEILTSLHFTSDSIHSFNKGNVEIVLAPSYAAWSVESDD
jgi:hypothetical protein